MGDTKFTPGPWCIVDGETIKIRDANNNTLANCTFVHMYGRREHSEVISNAHLIAAAPEMYEALANITNGIETGAVRIESDEDERLENAMRQISAALAKARGESNG